MATRLFVKVTRELLPQVKDKFPFLYLEHGRLEVDDSSVKWISAENLVLAIPVATINCLMLGPGTSITQEAVKVISSANCGLAWVGEDSLHFFAGGITPTATTRNLLMQVKLASDPELALGVVRKMCKSSKALVTFDSPPSTIGASHICRSSHALPRHPLAGHTPGLPQFRTDYR